MTGAGGDRSDAVASDGLKPRDDRASAPGHEDADNAEASDADPGVLLDQIERLERSLEAMRRQTERLANVLFRAGKLTLPFGVLAALLLGIRLFFPEHFAAALTRMGSGLFLGKLSAIGGQENFWFWLIVLGTVDVVVGLFLVWNFDILFGVPVIGPRFAAFEARSSSWLMGHGWVRRLAFLGIVLVVIVPFQGTGAVMGSILGRLIGIGPWRTFLAIVIGAYTGVALVLSGSAAVAGLSRINPLTGAALAALLVGAGVFAWARWFRGQRPAPAADAGKGGAGK